MRFCAIEINVISQQQTENTKGIIVAHNGKASKLSELGGNPTEQKIKINNLPQYEENGGEFSLQNALILAKTSLCSIPIHGSREIILITAALSTVDPNDIFKTIRDIKINKIRVSCVSLSAELHIIKGKILFFVFLFCFA